jgi:hypothetical protein
MEHAIEIDNIKKDLRVTQDSVLLIHQDLKSMSKGISEMATSMKIMVDVQSDMRLMSERIESRHMSQKETNSLLHSRIDATRDIDKKANNGNTAYLFLVWTGKILGTSLLLTAAGLFIWAIQIKGVN